MKLLFELLAVSALTEAARSSYRCTTFFIPIPVVNVTTIVPFFSEFADEYAATSFGNAITQRDAPTPHISFTTLTKTFNISGSVCKPVKPGPKATTLQILTHGLGFNRSYWDLYLPNYPQDTQHSYIHAATQAGYTTLSYNRLGIEPSTIGNPYTEIQTTVELSILASLTTLARVGKIPGLAAPKKVIHVGHSYGSQLSNALAATAPELSDGLVLTGYSGIGNFTGFFIASTSLHLASNDRSHRFPASKYSSGFLTWPDKLANQFSFFSYPYFDPAVLVFAESTKYPFTIGEFISQVPTHAPNFNGPVLYLAAEHDLIFCASNCTGLFGRDSAAVTAFSGAGSVETYIQPHVGHGINLHKNSTGAYGVVMNWAERHGF